MGDDSREAEVVPGNPCPRHLAVMNHQIDVLGEKLLDEWTRELLRRLCQLRDEAHEADRVGHVGLVDVKADALGLDPLAPRLRRPGDHVVPLAHEDAGHAHRRLDVAVERDVNDCDSRHGGIS